MTYRKLIDKWGSGVVIYLFGVVIALLVNNMLNEGQLWWLFNAVLLVAFNPFMIHVYDFKYFKDKFNKPRTGYITAIISAYIIELVAWNFIRPVTDERVIFFSFIGQTLIVCFILNGLIVRSLRKRSNKECKSWHLWIFPILTYDLFAVFGTWFMLLMSQWDGKI